MNVVLTLTLTLILPAGKACILSALPSMVPNLHTTGKQLCAAVRSKQGTHMGKKKLSFEFRVVRESVGCMITQLSVQVSVHPCTPLNSTGISKIIYAQKSFSAG